MEYGYGPWWCWFAWLPVRLDGGGWTWGRYLRRRKFTHEPIWGAAPDPHWDYALNVEEWTPWLLWRAWWPVPLDGGGWTWLTRVRCRRGYESGWSGNHWFYELVSVAPVNEPSEVT